MEMLLEMVLSIINWMQNCTWQSQRQVDNYGCMYEKLELVCSYGMAQNVLLTLHSVMLVKIF
jgi:hypothetical protein